MVGSYLQITVWSIKGAKPFFWALRTLPPSQLLVPVAHGRRMPKEPGFHPPASPPSSPLTASPGGGGPGAGSCAFRMKWHPKRWEQPEEEAWMLDGACVASRVGWAGTQGWPLWSSHWRQDRSISPHLPHPTPALCNHASTLCFYTFRFHI